MIIATAGHVDHGKTLLVQALTGIDTDRLPEEKRRGLTIDLGFAYESLPDGTRLGFVDVPGHERFVKNMAAGVSVIDFALLVVAADDGPMPQTLEHLDILGLFRIPRGVVALTKVDRVDQARIGEVKARVRDVLAGTFLEGAPIIGVSALTGEGMAALQAHLAEAARRCPERAAGGRFRLAIDRSFTIAGAGTVVTGAVFSGQVSVGDNLVLSPTGIAVRVRTIHTQNEQATMGVAGDRCALNVVGAELRKAEIHRGDWLLASAAHHPTDRIDVDLKVLDRELRPLRDRTPAHLHLGAADVTCRVALLEARAIEPGDRGLAQLVLERPIATVAGDRLILRDQSAKRTIAGGRVVDPFPPRRGRARPARLVWLRAMNRQDPRDAASELLFCQAHGLDLGRFADAWNLDETEAEEIWSGLSIVITSDGATRTGFSQEHWQGLRRTIVETLCGWHAARPDLLGPDEMALARALPANPNRGAARAAIDELAREGAVGRRALVLHLPGHEVRPTPRELRSWQRIAPRLAEGGLRPPRHRELAAELDLELAEVERFMVRAEALGWVRRVTENRSFPLESLLQLGKIAEGLSAHAEDGRFSAQEFKDASAIGRNLTIELLEFFDRVVLTAREGERRKMVRAAGELFGDERAPSLDCEPASGLA